MSDNPFSEPDDDKTVIRPRPGSRRPVTPQAVRVPVPAPAPIERPALLPDIDPNAPPAFSVSPLATAASPVLQLLAQLRGMHRAPDPQALRQRVTQSLRDFERKAREAQITMDLLRPAHFALCASIDDVVLNTPWGQASGWADQTLLANFHPGSRGTDQFFDQLRQMRREPDRNLPVIELMYLCLSLGFLGRYRKARDSGEFDDMRAKVHAAITAQRPPADPGLSRHWHGVAAAYRPGRRGVPVWVAFAGAVAVCGGLLFWTSFSLNVASDGLQARALSTPPAHMPQLSRSVLMVPVPAPPPPPEPTVIDRLSIALQPDIQRGTVALLGAPATPIIRINDRGMFGPSNATMQAASVPLLERVAVALRNEGGAVRVNAYTDNQPVRTVQFPSNFQLSAARANAVRTILARAMGEPARISAEGRADADPIAPNTTTEGRELNRRIEIVLRRTD